MTLWGGHTHSVWEGLVCCGSMQCGQLRNVFEHAQRPEKPSNNYLANVQHFSGSTRSNSVASV